jgi:Mrp family chromosome partitioning ATPase
VVKGMDVLERLESSRSNLNPRQPAALEDRRLQPFQIHPSESSRQNAKTPFVALVRDSLAIMSTSAPETVSVTPANPATTSEQRTQSSNRGKRPSRPRKQFHGTSLLFIDADIRPPQTAYR